MPKILRCPYCQHQLSEVSSNSWECLNAKACEKGESVDFVRRFGMMYVRSVGDDDQYTWKIISKKKFGTGRLKEIRPSV